MPHKPLGQRAARPGRWRTRRCLPAVVAGAAVCAAAAGLRIRWAQLDSHARSSRQGSAPRQGLFLPTGGASSSSSSSGGGGGAPWASTVDVALRALEISAAAAAALSALHPANLPEAPAPQSWERAERFPRACRPWGTGLSGMPRLLRHRRRGLEGGPHSLDPPGMLRRIRNISESTRGMQVVAADAQAVPELRSPPPLASSHGGQHSLWRDWAVVAGMDTDNRMARNPNSSAWKVRFFRDPREAAGPPQVLPPEPPPWAVVIPNAWAHDGEVYSCDWGYTAGACLWTRREFAVTRRAAVAAAVCDGWCAGYFHFTHEHLPRLALLHSALTRDESALVAAPVWIRFVREYLVDVLGIARSRIVGQDKGVFARKMLYAQPQRCGQAFTVPLLLLRHIVFARLGLPWVLPPAAARPPCTTLGGERCEPCGAGGGWCAADGNASAVCAPWCSASPVFLVLLAERGKRGRMPLNWEDAAEALRRPFPGVPWSDQLRVYRVAPGLPVTHQVRLFNAAGLAVGPHGANLANVMWMRTGATAVEITSYHYGNMCYYTTAARIGVTWRFILHSGSKAGNVTIDPEELRRHADDAVRRGRGFKPLHFD
eukprot:TRINITY_DN14434_c1_g2_i1.p1 TRINITY_DN14434_c1_g2~~TRINITY_DN14434_c1_g2_i1.p1  ORF type:complete len:626 (+),score=83.98 TRINITY_DN14434_c1_g2_i1:83-1879(+)